jgi:hypothetical protein
MATAAMPTANARHAVRGTREGNGRRARVMRTSRATAARGVMREAKAALLDMRTTGGTAALIAGVKESSHPVRPRGMAHLRAAGRRTTSALAGQVAAGPVIRSREAGVTGNRRAAATRTN